MVMRGIVGLHVPLVRPGIIELGLHHMVHLYEGQHDGRFIKPASEI